jgi:uncharacterized protein
MIWILLVISIILVILVMAYISVPWAENKVLFFPVKKHYWKPGIEYEDVYIRVNKNHKRDTINAWYFNNFPGHKTVMFCHGNSGNISNRGYIINICQKFHLNLMIFDYRGFGRSRGKPSKNNLRQDGEEVYKYIRKRGVKPKNIIIWGESLGGYVAIWTASKYRCRSLLLLCTFSGLDDAIVNYCSSDIAKLFANIYTSLVSLRYDMMLSRENIKKVRCPVVIMHSKEDDLIPYQCAKILYDNVCHDSKLLITIKGGHSSPIITEEDLNKLFMYCDIPLPFYENKVNIKGMLKQVETIAAKHNNFIK